MCLVKYVLIRFDSERIAHQQRYRSRNISGDRRGKKQPKDMYRAVTDEVR